MMNFKSVLFFLFACCLAACEWGVPHNKTKPAIAKDTLTYTYKALKEQAADCDTRADTNCTYIDISYPFFNSQNSLNDTLKKRLLVMFSSDNKPDTSLNQLAMHFLKQYEDDKKTNSRPDLVYTMDLDANVVRQDSSIVTLRIAGDTYQGGAHGSHTTIFINWDTKSNKLITLNDIFVDSYHDQLTKTAEHIFRKQENLSDTTSLKNNYFFKDDKFSLNDNYLITPEGIRFLYNEYEIKPYAAGQTNLLIPYSQIKSLLRPNTAVSQYIK